MVHEVKKTMSRAVQSLTPRHYKILDFAIQGMNALEISRALNMSRTQVGVVMASPSFKHQFGLRRAMHEEKVSDNAVKELDKTKSALRDSALNAAQTLVGGLSSADERIKIKSASEILDRAGYPKETIVDGGTNTTILIDSKQLNIMNETLNMLNEPSQAGEFRTTGND